MKVRLAFSVAAHLEPEILIIDEVLAVGDAEFQKKCLGKMGDMAGSGRTVLFVSHNMAAVQSLCQRAILLENGRCVQDGSPNHIIGTYLQTIAEITHFPLDQREDRKGTGNIRFTAIGLCNKDREVVPSFVCGEDAVLVLHFENYTSGDLRNLVVNIGLDNQMDQRIALLSNEITGDDFATVSADMDRVEVVIPRMPLKPGRYKFTLFGRVNGIIADWIHNAGFFDVEPGDYYGSGRLPPMVQGDFMINHQFSLPGSVPVAKASLS
jgi:lipopolysaccharide transport system ATP-binding protein